MENEKNKPTEQTLMEENQRLKAQQTPPITVRLMLKKSIIYSVKNWMPLSLAMTFGYYWNDFVVSKTYDELALVITTALGGA